MGTQEGVAFPDSCEENDRVWLQPLPDILDDQILIAGNPDGAGNGGTHLWQAPLFLHIEAFFQIAFLLQNVNNDIVEVVLHNAEACISIIVFCFHISDPVAHLQLLGRIVIKNIVSNLIAHAAVFQKAGLPDLRLRKIKFFFNGHYATPVIAFRIAVWFDFVRYCSRERSSSGGVIQKSFLFSVVTSPASHSARV